MTIDQDRPTPRRATRRAARPILPGPDFLCVGLQKGGTQWLYDQLQHHRDFWMPPFKELHYFDREFPYSKLERAARTFLERPARARTRRSRRGDAKLTERGAEFFRRVVAFDAEQGDLDAYEKLFELKQGKLSGDVTPGYSTLDEATIGRIASRFDQAKALLMLREPASRAWSHWRMANLEAPESVLLDVRALRTFLDRPEVVARCYPSVIAGKWSSAFGERFKFFFLDDVADRPDETRADILRFLGANPNRQVRVQPDFNRKAKTANPSRTEEIKALLQDRFADERRACAALFGGPAAAWPDAPY